VNHYVCITGGRDFKEYDRVKEVIRILAAFYGDKLRFMHGDAKGADRLGRDAAIEFGVPIKKFPADWDTHGKAAGPIRNQEMIDYLKMCRRKGHSVQVIAFPGGDGTADMVKRAETALIDVDLQ